MIPRKEVHTETKRADIKRLRKRKLFTFIPKLSAISSPQRRALNFQLRKRQIGETMKKKRLIIFNSCHPAFPRSPKVQKRVAET